MLCNKLIGYLIAGVRRVVQVPSSFAGTRVNQGLGSVATVTDYQVAVHVTWTFMTFDRELSIPTGSAFFFFFSFFPPPFFFSHFRFVRVAYLSANTVIIDLDMLSIVNMVSC